MPSIWEKYQKIEELNSNSKIKTYKAKIEPIIIEIIPEDKNDFYKIKGRLEIIKRKYKIIEILEEIEKFYIVVNKDDELLSKIDKLLLTDELNIEKEDKIEGNGSPISKNEILNLLKMEHSMCRITFERIENNKDISDNGSGFFCEIEGNFPIKYALFSNNHILNESNLEIGKLIKLKYFESSGLVEKNINLTNNRKTFTNKELGYTCIEIFESDGIKNFFKVEPHIILNQSKDGKIFEENDIFALQFPDEKEIFFSDGNIMHIKDNEIIHQASIEGDFSGVPIIIRDKNNKDNFIIGLHKTTIKDGNKFLYNLATTFDSILDNIKEQINEINCIYIPDKNKEEIYLLHDYNCDISEFVHEDNKKIYLEAKNMNKNIFENNIDLYINDNKVNFNFKYKFNDSKEIKVKFKFKKVLTNLSFMFYGCSSLKSLNFSSFYSNKVNNMKGMLQNCSSLESINLLSFNTSNVTDMSYMCNECSSLEFIDLSKFNTSKVQNMKAMFQKCSSLKSLDLSSFNTSNVNDMSCMLNNCSCLKNIDLSKFDTIKVNNMKGMFQECSSLRSINLISFNTSNVNDMSYMFNNCSSIIKIDLSKFNTNQVINMKAMFQECSSLKSLDLSSFNTNNVNDMSYMFNYCSSIEYINLSKFITNKVNNMNSMFQGCTSLKSLDLSLFDTSKISNMMFVFDNCYLRKDNIKINNKEDKIVKNIY